MALLAQLDIDSTYAGARAARAARDGRRARPDLRAGDEHRDARRRAADAGVASAMVNTSQQVGGSIGTALLSTIFAERGRPATPTSQARSPALALEAAMHGYTTAFWCSSAVFLVGASSPHRLPLRASRRSRWRPSRRSPTEMARQATGAGSRRGARDGRDDDLDARRGRERGPVEDERVEPGIGRVEAVDVAHEALAGASVSARRARAVCSSTDWISIARNTRASAGRRGGRGARSGGREARARPRGRG